MVLRKNGPLLLLHAFLSTLAYPAFATDIIDLNTSGQAGSDGQAGTSHSGSASSGSDGRNGGHATTSSPGQDAGSISVRLEA